MILALIVIINGKLAKGIKGGGLILSMLLTIIGLLSVIIGIVCIGDASGSYGGGDLQAALGLGSIISGIFTFGFAKVISLLTQIRDRLPQTNSTRVTESDSQHVTQD